MYPVGPDQLCLQESAITAYTYVDSSSDRSLLLCRGFEVEEGGKKAVSHFIVYDHIILQSEALTRMSERALISV